MHRTSRVDLDKNNILFPIRTAVDLAGQRAERCKHLHEAVDGNVVPTAIAEGGESGEVGPSPNTSLPEPCPDRSGNVLKMSMPINGEYINDTDIFIVPPRPRLTSFR